MNSIRGLKICGAIGALLTGGWWLKGAAGQVSVQPIPPDRPFVPPHPWPRPRPVPQPVRDQELRLVKQSSRVAVRGPLARVQIAQTFENPTNRRVEGTYLFPLPKGAAVSGFAMTMNGKRMDAEILEGGKAREIYEGIVARLRDPAILEFAERDLLRTRIFPLDPGAKVEMELTYSQTLTPDGSSLRLTIPQRLPLGGSPEISEVAVDLDLPDVKGVFSPTHTVKATREKGAVQVTGKWDGKAAGNDFTLVAGIGNGKVGLSGTVYRNPGEDPFFLLLAAPDSSLKPAEVDAKDVVFVLDTSGSMQGEKMEQARKALLALLGNLNPTDRFGMVSFASDVDSLSETMLSASAPNLADGKRFAEKLKAAGGTNISEALATARKLLGSATNRPRQIVFLTDGQPTVGETNIDRILDGNDKGDSGVRLFTFGVGYDVNTRLLDSLAENNSGAADYVAPGEDIEVKVGSLYSRIAFPVWTDTALGWKGATAYDVYPRKVPDLFRGSQVIIVGRLKKWDEKDALPQVELSGKFAGREERVATRLGRSEDGADTIGRIWATRKVAFLLGDARRGTRPASDEVRDEVLQLSKKYGIVTPLTAGLITEDDAAAPGRPVPLRGIPYPAPMPRTDRQAPMTSAAPSGGPRGNQRFSRLHSLESGRAAVDTSRDLAGMAKAESAAPPPAESSVRTIAGKTFQDKGGVWQETGLTEQEIAAAQTVPFASPRYFELSRDANVARWLTVGSNLVFRFKGTVYKVVAAKD